MDAVRRTGVSWATVNKARWHRVSTDCAKLLSKFTQGAVKAADIAKEPRKMLKRAG